MNSLKMGRSTSLEADGTKPRVSQPANLPVLHASDHVDGLSHLYQYASRFLQQDFPSLGPLDAAVGPLEEPNHEILQPLYLVT